jgi:hypothetical protein
MTQPTFLQLPVNADEGFPQAFRMAVGDQIYTVTLQADVAEELLPTPGAPPGTDNRLDAVLNLPQPGAFLVGTLARDDADGETVLLRRKLVPGLVYRAGELLLTVQSMQVAMRNLGGPGSYGSQIVAGVALR